MRYIYLPNYNKSGHLFTTTPAHTHVEDAHSSIPKPPAGNSTGWRVNYSPSDDGEGFFLLVPLLNILVYTTK